MGKAAVQPLFHSIPLITFCQTAQHSTLVEVQYCLLKTILAKLTSGSSATFVLG